MSALVDRYRRLLAEQRERRIAAGGKLSDAEEEEWTEQCHDIWMQMSWEERDQAESMAP